MSPRMKSQKRGKNILKVEILNVSIHGLWILIKDHEYFLPFKDFPWFKNASIKEIHNFKVVHRKYLSWPDIDVDLEIESIKSPEKYPLRDIA